MKPVSRKIWIAGAAGLLAVIALSACSSSNGGNDAQAASEQSQAAGAGSSASPSVSATSNQNPENMGSDGFLITGTNSYQATPAIPNGGSPTPTTYTNDGKVHITTYIDFQCPYCEQFETTNDPQIQQWIAAGKATLEIHPLSFLDRLSNGNNYSTRSDNAAACVANYDPANYFNVVQEFYRNQPKEGGNGRTDAELLSELSTAGVSSSQVTSCVKNQTFKTWVQESTDRQIEKTMPNVTPTTTLESTPTIIVNGAMYPASDQGALTDPSAFKSFVEKTVPGVQL